jgi:hypothetical protein
MERKSPGARVCSPPELDRSMTLVEGDVGYQIGGSLDLLAGIRRVSASAGLAADAGTLTEADGGFTDPNVRGGSAATGRRSSGLVSEGTSAASAPAPISAGS